MIVDLIEGTEAIAAQEENWRAVYDADPEARYFLSYEWLYGTPAGPGRNAVVMGVRPQGPNSTYFAYLPLRFRTELGQGGFHTEFGCSGNYVSDYNGFICRPEHEERAIPALGDALKQMTWQNLRLLSFAASPKRTELFLSRFPEEHFDFTPISMVNPDGVDNSVCPSTALSHDWDDFLQARLSANARQKIRRYLRQVEGSDGYLITHTNADTLERDVELLLALWTNRWGHRKGKRLSTIQDINRRLIKHAFATGTLFMPVLWQEDRAICALAILVDHRKKVYHFLIGGREESFQTLPAGLVMHGYAIRHAITEGMIRYDFLRGNEPYKYSFGAEEFHLKSMLIESRDHKANATGLDRRSLPIVFRRAGELWREDKPKASARGYAQILEFSPNNARALYLGGIANMRIGNHAAAATQFRTLAALRPDSVKVWFRLGQALASRGEWAEVVATFRALLGRKHGIPRAWFLMGRALYNLEDYKAAFEAFDTALKLKAGYADAERGYLMSLRKCNEIPNSQQELPISQEPKPEIRIANDHASLRGSLSKLGKRNGTVSAIDTVMASAALASRRLVIRKLTAH